jgi:hypothetical protein
MAESRTREPSPGRYGLAQPLPPEKRESPSLALGTQWLNAICFHPSRLFCIPPCQPTTVWTEKHLGRIGLTLHTSFTRFTGRDHR